VYVSLLLLLIAGLVLIEREANLNAMGLVPKVLCKVSQNLLVNLASLSEAMTLGNPCILNSIIRSLHFISLRRIWNLAPGPRLAFYGDICFEETRNAC
jgi:hypothetical protein